MATTTSPVILDSTGQDIAEALTDVADAINAGNATAAMLAYVENGSMASQSYPAGTYICWQSLLYTADSAINAGDAFNSTGANKNLTAVGGGGVLNSVIKPTTTQIANETWGTIDETRSGNVVVFSFRGNANTPPSSDRNRFLDYTVDIKALSRGVGIGTPGGANNLFMLVPSNSNLLRLYFGSSYQAWTDCSVTIICE